jgi:DNA-binding Lrp family transcriptional regulator
MLSELKRYFPNSPNREVAELLGVSERTMIRKARELGLVKEKKYISKNATTKSLCGVLARQRKV